MYRTTRTGKPAGRLAALLVVPALLLAFTGCSAAKGGGEPSSTPQAMSRQEWTLKYAQCMRSHGQNVPDPTSDGTISAQAGGDIDAAKAASEACRKQLGDMPPLTASEKQAADKAMQEQMVKIAQCYRKNGVDVPDPAPGQVVQIPSDAPDGVRAQCGDVTGAAGSAG
jgi:hypothetical protein